MKSRNNNAGGRSLLARVTNGLQMLARRKNCRKRRLPLSQPSAGRIKEPWTKLKMKRSRHWKCLTWTCSVRWPMMARTIEVPAVKVLSLQSRSRRRAGRMAVATSNPKRGRRRRVPTLVQASAPTRCVLLHPLHCTLDLCKAALCIEVKCFAGLVRN